MFLFDSLMSLVDGAVDVAAAAVDAVIENPIKTVCMCGAGVVTGGLVTVFAAPIAAAIGTTGLLGATASGTAISSLSGVALTNASLAALGGGALAAGGGGMAAGVTTLAVTGAAAGTAVSAVALDDTKLDD